MACLKIDITTIMQVAQTFVLIIIVFLAPSSVSTSNLTNTSNWTTCEANDSLDCRCTSDVLTDVIARCHFSHMTDVMKIINLPQDLVRLNLSGNKIQDIPRHSFKRYTELIYLSLSFNNIHTISQGAFSGLKRLRELNLQGNKIKNWDTTFIEQDLPTLIMLNVGQNNYWKPDQHILLLQNLKIIFLLLVENPGNYWRPFKCYILRRNIQKTKEINYSFEENIPAHIDENVTPNALIAKLDDCWRHKVYFRDASYWDVIVERGFYFHCIRVKSNQYSLNSTYTFFKHDNQHTWYYIQEVMNPYCWNTIRRIHIITLIEGICALVFNMIVIITTLRSRVLRESVAHVLVANMAVGDLLISFYMIIITTTRKMMDAIEYDDFCLPYYCRIVGLIFLIGQFSSPMMSFIMTLERYLAVVYCMRPHIRITRRMAYVVMVIVWCLSLSLAVSFMISPKFSSNTEDMCIPLNNSEGTPVLHYVAGIGVLSYFVAIALYGHMYVDFQKTNQKTVQLQKENSLARRIALIMFTNLLFFIIPLIAVVIVESHSSDPLSRYIFYKTFAIMCLGVNSCFNPFLFSFRNERFQNEVRKNCPFCRNSVASQSV